MKTRFGILLTMVASLSIGLTACNETASVTQVIDPGLRLGIKLAAGTLKLEDSDQAVTSTQAAELLTFWQAYQALSNDETTAQAELDGLIQQIQGVLSDQQLQAIESMQLTDQSVAEMVQSLSADFGMLSNQDKSIVSSTDQSVAGIPGNIPGGPAGGPGGIPSDDMSAILGGGGMDLATQSTPDSTAMNQDSMQSARISSALLNALISFLQGRM